MKNIQISKECWSRFRWLTILSIILFAIILNLTTVRFELDLIILTIFAISILLGDIFNFIIDWLPPLSGFWFYERTRAIAYMLSERFQRKIIIGELIDWEHKFFFFLDKIPTVKMQEIFYSSGVTRWYDHLLFFFYTSYFWLWISAGFIIWKLRRNFFKQYMYGLLGFSLFGNIIYFLWPTAPPWYASEIGLLPPLTRIMWNISVLPRESVQVVNILGQNLFAALPSHHVAWPFYTALFMTYLFGKKALSLLIFPIVITVAVVYGAEHYFIDALAGCITASIGFYLVIKLDAEVIERKFKQLLSSLQKPFLNSSNI